MVSQYLNILMGDPVSINIFEIGNYRKSNKCLHLPENLVNIIIIIKNYLAHVTRKRDASYKPKRPQIHDNRQAIEMQKRDQNKEWENQVKSSVGIHS